MIISIHQPYFLPWLGYFSKMQWADGFLALPAANFRKRHYHDRAKIITMQGKVGWINVPVGEHFGSTIDEVPVPKSGFRRKVLRTLRYSYAHAAAFDEEWGDFEQMFVRASTRNSLAEMNLALIKGITSKLLDLPAFPIWEAVEMSLANNATERLIHQLKHVGAKGVVLGSGASLKAGIHDIDLFKRNGLAVYVQDFLAVGISYQQFRRNREGFVSGLSIVDALLNVGRKEIKGLLQSRSLKPEKVC